jgi:hypothetical protein
MILAMESFFKDRALSSFREISINQAGVIKVAFSQRDIAHQFSCTNLKLPFTYFID